MKHSILLLFVFALVVSACGSPQAGQGTLPVPSQWKLESLGKSGSETPVITGSTVTLAFEAGNKISGNGGCNSYGGDYQISGDKLIIANIASTLMACADNAVTQQETQYLQALKSATRFEISGDKLTIWYGDGGSQLNFVKE